MTFMNSAGKADVRVNVIYRPEFNLNDIRREFAEGRRVFHPVKGSWPSALDIFAEVRGRS